MKNDLAIELMLKHDLSSTDDVFREVRTFFGDEFPRKEAHWGVLECSEIMRFREYFSDVHYSVWVFHFKDKTALNKYKITSPSNYEELRSYAEQKLKLYDAISNDELCEPIPLDYQISDSKDDEQ